MNLDEQLKEIARPQRANSAKQGIKHKIISRIAKEEKRSRWSFRLIFASFCILLLLLINSFYGAPAMNQEQTASPFGNIDERTTIEKVTLLENRNPEKMLNLKSPLFPLKKSTAENESFDVLQKTLLSAKNNAVPWYGTIYSDFQVYDLYFYLSNGEEVYLKLDDAQDYYLIDPHAEMKYQLTGKEWRTLNSFSYNLLEQERWSTAKKIAFFSSIAILLAFSIWMDRRMKKKYNAEPEEKEKSFSWIKFGISLMAILSLNYFENKMGTLHLGVLALYFIFIFGIDYLVKFLSKQSIHWKYEFIGIGIGLCFFLIFYLFFV